ncbi:gliding motility associated protien GldN [Halpernia frigidisoli]|uniref:Gliding motility associated protien GldN n=2 Tax=Halpernia frigidisoli TaxID=1125876 RepID=A0A1I3FB13_9FLAO|nr:gliding motility associated protien GldN [Halpernia frigidisoli]
MRKILFLLLAFGFLGLNAQKRKTTKRKAKTTKAVQPKVETGADTAAVEAAAAAEASTPTVADVPEEPVNSMSILNAKSPESFRKYRELGMMKQGDSMVSTKTEPLKYGFIEDKDVLKSMLTWEVLDMNEKLNQPFYHNEDGLVSQNKSLYQILLDAVNNGEIKEVYDDELFTTRLSPDAIAARTRNAVITDAGTDLINQNGKLTDEEKKEYTNVYETKTENVKVLKIKGMWYINKRDGEMKYRLLGICAMGQDPSTMGQYGPDGQPLASKDELIDLFWVYYPDARKVLANNIVFNSKNLSTNVSYDDVLNARRFSSIIYKVDNGLGTGVIKDYIPKDAQAQLDESDRIKNQILQMENDMWSY